MSLWYDPAETNHPFANWTVLNFRSSGRSIARIDKNPAGSTSGTPVRFNFILGSLSRRPLFVRLSYDYSIMLFQSPTVVWYADCMYKDGALTHDTVRRGFNLMLCGLLQLQQLWQRTTAVHGQQAMAASTNTKLVRRWRFPTLMNAVEHWGRSI